MSRAIELSEHAGAADALMQALYLQADLHISRWETRAAVQVGERMLRKAAETGVPAHLALAQAATGDAYWFAGDCRRACEYLEPAIAYFEAHPDEVDPFTAAFDHAIVDHIWCALSYEILADRPHATRHAEASLARVPRGHPSRVFVIVFAGCLLQWLHGDEAGVEQALDELTGAAQGLSLPPSLSPWVALWQGWRRARHGDPGAL